MSDDQKDKRAVLAAVAETFVKPATPQGLVPMLAFAFQEGGYRNGYKLLATGSVRGNPDHGVLRLQSTDGRIIRIDVSYE